MAYYVGTQEFATLREADNYVRANGGTVTTQPVSTDGGMLTSPASGTTSDASTTTGINPEGTVTGNSKGDENVYSTDPVGSVDPETSDGGETGIDRVELMEEAEQLRLQEVQERYEARIAEERAERAAREEETGQREYVYVSARDLDEGQERPVSSVTEVKTATGHAGLRSLYNSKGQYDNTFGSVQNFIGYMDSLYELQQSDPDTYNWWETYNYEEWKDFTYSPQDLRQRENDRRNETDDPDDSDQYGDEDLRDDYRSWRTSEHKSSFSLFDRDANYQQLLTDYNVQLITYNSDGDEYHWNGSFPVKMVELSDGFDLGDAFKMAAVLALNFYGGNALSGFLAPSMGATAAAATSAGIMSSATQLAMTGEVDFGQALESALTAGLQTELVNQLLDSGILENIQESLGSLTQDTVQLADGQEFPLILAEGGGYAVVLPSGNTIGYEAFFQAAEGLFGSPVVAEITRDLSDFFQDLTDVFEESGTAQAVINALGMSQEGGSGSGSLGATVSGDLNFESADGSIIAQLTEAIEAARQAGNNEEADALQAELDRYQQGIETEEEEVVDPNESTVDETDSELEDTTTTVEETTETGAEEEEETTETTGTEEEETTETTGTEEETEENPPGITEEMFSDVVEQIRADNEVTTEEIINAINALGVADLPTLAQIQEAFPELNDVSLEQISDTVSTLLSEAGLLTTEDFNTAMAGVLTPEQLATALADLPYGTLEDFVEALGNAGFATPADIATALSESGLATPEDIATALSESGLATLEEIVEAFTTSGLATSEDIAGLARALSQSGFATPQDIADALDAAGLATPQDIVDAIAEAGLATPEDVANALAEFNFSDAQLEQIVNALPEGLTRGDLTEALEGVVVGEDLDAAVTTITDAIGALDIASAQDVRDALSEFNFTEAQLQQIIDALPEGLSTSDLSDALSDVVIGEDLETAVTTITDAISGLDIASAQDVRDALAEFNFSDEQLAQIINALPENLTVEDLGTALEGIVVGEDLDTAVTTITDAIGDLAVASPDDIRDILANYGFTEEQLEQIAGAITIPASATIADVQEIVDGIPAGLTAEEVATELNSQFEGITEDIAGVQTGIDELAEQLGLSTEGLLTAIAGLGTTTGEDLTDLQTNILEGLESLSDDLGVDISDVVTSVTDLESGVAEGIEGLGEQLTGVEEAVGGVTTAVTQGVEDLAEALGVQTDDITSAIVTLGSGLGGELTELETNVLLGLTNLADSFGTDVGTVVDSITGLGTGLGENIQGLSDTLVEQLGAGFGGIGGQLEAGFGQLGQQLGLATLGLFGLGAKQPTAQEIAAAQDKFEFRPFEEQMKPRQVQQVVQSRPVQQQPTALQQINQFIDRQTTTPKTQPINQGMFTGDPDRKLA